MQTFLLVINIVSAIAMVVVILLQHGRGADLGSAFGSGSRGSLVGITGSANFLSKSTSALATVFFVTALALGILSQTDESDTLIESLSQPAPQAEVVDEEPMEKEDNLAGGNEVPSLPADISDY